MIKYNTIKELSDAFKKGELKNYKLMLDNDMSQLVYIGDEGNESDELNDEASDWFHGKGYADLQEALEAAGIPCFWC